MKLNVFIVCVCAPCRYVCTEGARDWWRSVLVGGVCWRYQRRLSSVVPILY